MNFLLISLLIIGIIIFLLFVFGFPRKKIKRIPSLEGIDSPEVAKAFELMSNLPPFQLLYKKVVSELNHLNPKGKLVDVGCGTGSLIIKIAQKIQNLKIFGIDISKEILNYAEKNSLKHSFQEKIEYKIGNVNALPFPDASIDFIISTFSLHHWVEPIDAFREIFRVLKKDGTYIIFDFRRNSRKIFYGFFKIITKLIVPKAVKNVNEPLGSLKASYTPDEVKEFLNYLDYKIPEFKFFLAWMLIIGRKTL